jgi:hypothetical protein
LRWGARNGIALPVRLSGKDPLMADIDDTEKPGSAAALIPNDPDLDSLREAAAECTACPLYAKATQPCSGRGRGGRR